MRLLPPRSAACLDTVARCREALRNLLWRCGPMRWATLAVWVSGTDSSASSYSFLQAIGSIPTSPAKVGKGRSLSSLPRLGQSVGYAGGTTSRSEVLSGVVAKGAGRSQKTGLCSFLAHPCASETYVSCLGTSNGSCWTRGSRSAPRTAVHSSGARASFGMNFLLAIGTRNVRRCASCMREWLIMDWARPPQVIKRSTLSYRVVWRRTPGTNPVLGNA